MARMKVRKVIHNLKYAETKKDISNLLNIVKN